jgi:hypothetical protein
MSNATMKEKIILQASQLNNLQLRMNYLVQELFKANPTHDLFEKNPEMTKKVKESIDLESSGKIQEKSPE